MALIVVLIGRDGGLSPLSHSCGFDYQQRVLNIYSGPPLREWGILARHLLVNLYIELTISSCYGSTDLSVNRDDD